MTQQNITSPTTKLARSRLVMNVLKLTEGTSIAPQAYERMLLDQFIEGELTIEEVLGRLERHTADNPAVGRRHEEE